MLDRAVGLKIVIYHGDTETMMMFRNGKMMACFYPYWKGTTSHDVKNTR